MIDENRQYAGKITRHIVRVVIHQELLDRMFREGHESRSGIKCIRGVPSDARFAGVGHDPIRQAVCFFYEHPSFKHVAQGDEIPEFDVVIGEGDDD